MTQSLNTVADSFLAALAIGGLLSGVGESYGFFSESVDIESFQEFEKQNSEALIVVTDQRC